MFVSCRVMVLGASSFGTSASVSLLSPPANGATGEQKTNSAPRRASVVVSLARGYMTEPPGEMWPAISLMVLLQGGPSKRERSILGSGRWRGPLSDRPARHTLGREPQRAYPRSPPA